MKKKTVYLLCGVSGAGKTWVCKQLLDKFDYVPHDENFKDPMKPYEKNEFSKDIITECPFAERVMKLQLEKLGFPVVPVFVIEPPHVIRERYKTREGKEPHKAAMTRASSIKNRALEWDAFHGDSAQVLKHLQDL